MACEPRGRSSLSCLQHRLELTRIAALHKEAVRIMAVGQRHGAHIYAMLAQSRDKRLSRLLTAAVVVGIKSQVDGSRTVAELAELARIKIGAHRAGDIEKAGLPQCGVVEQSVHQNHLWI